jgi:hypothetical protein
MEWDQKRKVVMVMEIILTIIMENRKSSNSNKIRRKNLTFL